MDRLHPSELRSLRFIAFQMIVGLAIFLGIGLYLRTIAFLLTPTYWPLIAAAVPLGTMLAWFPRAS